MKAKPSKTAFDRTFAEWMKDPKFAESYQEARVGIDSVDSFMRSLEDTRAKVGLSKTALARLTGTNPVVMRRLLTTEAPNPTLGTVMGILKSLGYGLALVPMKAPAKRKTSRKPKGSALSA